MVERLAVNEDVAGSSPAAGAKKNVRPFGLALFFSAICTPTSDRDFAQQNIVVAGSVQRVGAQKLVSSTNERKSVSDPAKISPEVFFVLLSRRYIIKP